MLYDEHLKYKDIGNIEGENEVKNLEIQKQVIDTKYAGWINDPKMSGYLRPSTLFGNKFEQYLNEKVKKSAQNQITRKEWDGTFASNKKY